MQMLVVVINNSQKFEELLLELSNNNISGGTIIDTMGMAKTLLDVNENIPMFGSLRYILNENKPINKTLFMVLSDDKVSIAMDCVRRVIPDLSEENVGIMLTIPVNHVEGLTK